MKRTSLAYRLTVILLLLVFAGCSSETEQSDTRLNILLIVADDMGYSDIGPFGSEIETPNLDMLAANGLVMTNFKVGPTCSPTRSMLYSGTDNHRNGLGTMNGMETDEQRGQPGYETYLNDRIVTFMTLLKDSGYHTYMAGKWQQGYRDGFYPLDRGFEKAYWLIAGGANHFADPRSVFGDEDPVYYREDYEVQEFPEDFYSANTHTDKLIEYIDSNKDDGQPFFAMASYTTPHWPLQVPDEYIEKYDGVYDAGYDSIREARIQRQRDLGILAPGQTPAPRHPEYAAWEDLSEDMKQRERRRMQVYAGMVDIMDENIGRLIDYLQQENLYDDTVIIFFSDNGAEGNDPGLLGNQSENVRFVGYDNSLENIGRPGSYTIQGPGWAHVSSTPFHLHKGFASEGGISSPLVIANSELIPGGRRSDAFATVLDVLPTFLELANVEHPGTAYQGREIFPPIGTSMLPLLTGEADAVHPEDYVYAGELWNRKIVRQGDWKLSWMNEPWGNDRWQLFNLAEDLGEQNDLAATNPDKLAELMLHWEAYKQNNGVIENPDFYVRYSNSNDYIQQD